ncbi:NAD(P)H-dependent oxidoreductase [Candidatus Moduliflexota bacterium]
MKVLVLLAHPSPGSFNHAIAAAASAELRSLGHEVLFHDLCEEGFDPLLPAGEIPRDVSLPEPVERHCRELRECGGIVIVHPNWWGQPPAILKGWVDRVIRPGVAYEFLEGDSGDGVPRGLLAGKRAMVFNTSNTPQRREEEVFGDPLELLWKNCIFSLCGIDEVRRKMFAVVVVSTPKERERWLEEVRATIREVFPGGKAGND